MRSQLMRALIAPAVLLALPSAAADFPNVGNLVQGEFHRFSQDLGAAFSYKAVTPATALGPLGFDVGIEVTDTSLEDESLFAIAGAGREAHIVIPKLHVHKGLPAGFDVGAFVGAAPDFDARLFGAELRYAILDDGIARPALGLRLSGTRATGLGDLRASTVAADLTLSKRFVALTPYVGAGTVRIQTSVAGSRLAEEKFNKSRVFGGLNLNLLTVNVAVEAEKMGDNTSLSAKVGWRF